MTASVLNSITQHLDQSPFSTLQDLQDNIRKCCQCIVSRSSIHAAVRQSGFSRKRTTYRAHREGLDDERAVFCRDQLAALPPNAVASIDESAFWFDMKPSDVHACWEKVNVDTKVCQETGHCHVELTGSLEHGMFASRNVTVKRGLQYCPTCDRYLNRDKNSALCIARVFTLTRINGEALPDQFKPRLKVRIANTNQPTTA